MYIVAGGILLYLHVRTGVAGILLDGLTGDSAFYTTLEDAASTSKAVEASSTDNRAELVLQLLLSGLEGPAPNIGHMLLGFDVEHGPEGMWPEIEAPYPRSSCNLYWSAVLSLRRCVEYNTLPACY